MATSELGHYVRHTETALDALDPADTGMLVRAIGNLDHLADQYAQRRVASVQFGTPFVTVADEPVSGTYYRLWTSTPFDLHVTQSGESYPCRVRLNVTSGHATNAASFYAVLAPRGLAETEAYRGDVNVATVSVARTTYAWEQPNALIYLDDSLVRLASESVSTIDSIGGSEVSARWLRVQLTVWVDVEVPASVAGLGGVELDEYLDP